MAKIESMISGNSEEFAENAAAMSAFVEEFRAIEQKVVDKENTAKEKFVKRGKLLPRERLNLLLDRGAPFLEISSLAGYKMHDDKDGSMAGGGIISLHQTTELSVLPVS